MQRFQLLSLGGLTLSGPEGPWSGKAARPRARALLAALARAGELGLTRDRLCFLLWSDRPQERARHSLDQLLYMVRADLGEGVVGRASDPVVLDSRRIRTDVAAFSAALAEGRLEEAVRCYAGPFLDGFHLSGAPEFDRWAAAERAELERCRREALESLALGAADGPDPAEAVRWCRRWAEADPLSSRAVLHFMEALVRAGDPAGALRAADGHATRLTEELGALPDPRITGFADQITSVPLPERLDGSAAPSGEGPDRAPSHVPPLIVIHAFADETGDAAGRVLGRSAAEWTAQALLRTGRVRVTLDLEGSEAATRADADIRGRVYRSGDDMLVQARVHGPGEELTVPDAIRVPADDPMSALDPLRRQVTAAIGTRFDPRIEAWRHATVRTPGLEAYRAFAAGHEEWLARRFGPAMERFREAIEHDPRFAPPRLWTAWTLIMSRRWVEAEEAVADAAREADLSPLDRAWVDRMEAHIAGDHERAFRAAQTMARLSPRSGWTWALVNTALDTRRHAFARTVLLQSAPREWGREEGSYWTMLAWTDHMLGQHERELQTTELGVRYHASGWFTQYARSMALSASGELEALLADLPALINDAPAGVADPGALLVALGREFRCHGHPERSAEFVDEALDRYATAAAPEWQGDPIHLAELWYDHGDLDRAAAMALDLFEADEGALAPNGLLGLVAAARGDAVEARKRSERIGEIRQPYLFGRPSLWRARIEAALGRPEAALGLLERGAAKGLDRFDWLDVHRAPELAEIRGSARYRRMLSRG